MKKNDNRQYNLLKTRHNLLKAIRSYFYRHKYIEVETPNLMKTAPPDPYVDPLEVSIEGKSSCHLHTSPEINMKKLLQFGHERIFQICKVYRVEEFEEMHSTEFTMLEWYRKGTYTQAMDEVEDLVCYIADRVCNNMNNYFKKPFKVIELKELLFKYFGMDPFKLNRDEFFHMLYSKGFTNIDDKDDWNSMFFKLFIQDIEPKIIEKNPYFIKDWPCSITTMAKRKDDNIVERFELYINGMEISNGYTELLDTEEQRRRFINDNREREKLSKKTFELDEEFLQVLSNIKGQYAGVSIGVDRLLMALLDKERIDDVLIQRFK